MTIHLQRLYKGLATLRSYQCQKAIGKKEKLQIECDGEIMTIPYEDIEQAVINKSADIPSKFDVRNTYQLWDFLFMPDAQTKEETESRQETSRSLV